MPLSVSRLHALLVRLPCRVRLGPVLAEERALGVDEVLLHFRERVRAGLFVLVDDLLYRVVILGDVHAGTVAKPKIWEPVILPWSGGLPYIHIQGDPGRSL